MLDVGAFFVLVYVSAQLLPSSVAAPMMALSAAVLMVLAWALLGERPRWNAVLGAGIGFGGVCLMLLADAGRVNPYGVLAAAAAMTMSSVGYILTRRWIGDLGVLAVTSWQLIAGGLAVVPVAVLCEGAFPRLDGRSLVGFGYVTVVATALAFAAWFAGLTHLNAATVGLVGLLNPVAGVVLGTVVAGEPFGPRQLAGVTVVLAGVVIGQRPRRDRSAALERVTGHAAVRQPLRILLQGGHSGQRKAPPSRRRTGSKTWSVHRTRQRRTGGGGGVFSGARAYGVEGGEEGLRGVLDPVAVASGKQVEQ